MQQKNIRIIYWISTGLLAAFMIFSAFSELAQTEQAQQGMIALGYPVYLNIILGIAKLLGVIALLQTITPTLKEWAYAGFMIDFIGAGLSITLSGGGITNALFVLPFIIVLLISYVSWKKKE